MTPDDSTRFGSFPAAKILQERVTRLDDPLVSKKVSRLLQDFNEGLNCIASIESHTVRVRLALLWRNDFLDRAAIHPELDAYIQNVMSSYHRDIVACGDAESVR